MFKDSTGTLFGALALSVGWGTSALAAPESDANAPRSAPDTIEEVVVTAQRRATDILKTPVAMSAYSAERLQGLSFEDLNSLSTSVHVSSYQGEAQIYIRGIGNSGIVGGSDSSTALHADGIYLSRSASAIPPYLDVERLELLRGPQGTLYGRNTTGGNINIISKGPGSKMEYEGQLTAGSYNRLRLFSAVGGPVSERVGIRLAAQREHRDGYTTVLRPGGGEDDIEDADYWMARLTVEIKPVDALTLTLKSDYYEADDAAVAWQYFDNGALTNPIYRALVPLTIRGAPYSRTYGSEIDHFNKLRIAGSLARLDWRVGGYTLSSLSGYRETRPLNRDDLDTAPVLGVDQLREEDQHQFSQEFQLTSVESERMQWVLGAYYFTEGNRVRNEYILPFVDTLLGAPEDPQCCILALRGATSTKAYAAFGEVTFRLTGRLEGVLGGRYSSELRDGENDFQMIYAPTTAFDNIADFDATRFNAFTPRVGLNFTVDPHTFLYLTASKGFKSGGFNPGSYQNDPFLPEKLWAYEAGAKLTRLDGRFRASTAAFFYDYTDLQVQDLESSNIVIRNAADARNVGMEVELSWRVASRFKLDAGVTWLDAKFTGGELTDPKNLASGLQALEGRRLTKAPEWKAGIAAQYTLAMRDGAALSIRGESIWQDEIFFSVFNTPQMREGAYAWSKARATYVPASGRWDLAAFVDNITDEAVATNRTYTGDIVDSFIVGNLAPPRTWGFEFAVRY